jgi:hypothetical protein
MGHSSGTAVEMREMKNTKFPIENPKQQNK